MVDKTELEKIREQIKKEKEEIRAEQEVEKEKIELAQAKIELTKLKNRDKIKELKEKKERREKSKRKVRKVLSGIKRGLQSTAKTIKEQQSQESVRRRSSQIFSPRSLKKVKGKKLNKRKIKTPRKLIRESREDFFSCNPGLGVNSCPTSLTSGGSFL